jgi:phosphatidylserine/phosphatidylglycerophosphate/cardiolipin synthase-like enzyme
MERNILYREVAVPKKTAEQFSVQQKWHQLFPDATSNLAEYLVDGTSTFASYVKAIETAQQPGHYIYILGWMLDIDFPLAGTLNPRYGKKDETYLNGDKTLLKLLTAAANRGVEIRVLIWNNPFYLDKNRRSVEALNKLPNTKIFIDSYTYTPQAAINTIRRIENDARELIKKVAPILLNPASRVKELYNVSPADVFNQLLYYLNKKNIGSHHEKNLVVKGREGLISYCGGIDINQNRFKSYHDTACKVKGPEAHAILNKFIKRWKNHEEARPYTLAGSKDSKPVSLGPVVGEITSAKIVGTYNSPDGKDRDRSLKQAYLKAIVNARNYIYIEDQYMVNLDVAKELNKKIKDYFFKKLIIVIQDSRETTDILIPDRKRGAFYNAVLANTTPEEKNKFSLFMIDDDLAKSRNTHPGLHSKTLIVDDELVIIGSANVNQRSFTLDSETSLIVFNGENSYYRDNFAYKFRHSLWRDFVINNSTFSQITWEEFVRNVNSVDGYSILRQYRNSIEDLDIRIIDKIKSLSVPLTYGVTQVFGKDFGTAIRATSILNSPVAIKQIFDIIWENIIDPEVK